MAAYPDLGFVPRQGLNHAAMRAILGCAKLYIDFGHHPGKDRMPREAARAGCCILTSRSGSAQYQADMPIPDDYKFDACEKQIPAIGEMIKSIFQFPRHREFRCPPPAYRCRKVQIEAARSHSAAKWPRPDRPPGPQNARSNHSARKAGRRAQLSAGRSCRTDGEHAARRKS